MSNWTDKDFETYTQSDWELIKSVKELTDTNLGNPAVLEFANEIALAIFGMLCVRRQCRFFQRFDFIEYALCKICVFSPFFAVVIFHL